MSGLVVVFQQTPLAVIMELPSDVTFPPPVAVVCVMFVTTVVATVGKKTFVDVEKVTSFPYAVPE